MYIKWLDDRDVRTVVALFSVILIFLSLLISFIPMADYAHENFEINLLNAKEPAFPKDFPQHIFEAEKEQIIHLENDEPEVPENIEEIFLISDNRDTASLVINLDEIVSVGKLWKCDTMTAYISPPLNYTLMHHADEDDWGYNIDVYTSRNSSNDLLIYSKIILNIKWNDGDYRKKISNTIHARIITPQPKGNKGFTNTSSLHSRLFTLYILDQEDAKLLTQYYFWKLSNYRWLFILTFFTGVFFIALVIHQHLKYKC